MPANTAMDLTQGLNTDDAAAPTLAWQPVLVAGRPPIALLLAAVDPGWPVPA